MVVRGGDPTHETTHLSIAGGTYDQVPVVGHQLVAIQLHGVAVQSLRQHLLERLVVPLLSMA